VRLLPQIENGDQTARTLQQKLKTFASKLSTARSVKIGQASVRRQLTFAGFKRVVSRAEVSRQTVSQLEVNVPNQYRRVRICRAGWRILLHEAGSENRHRSKKKDKRELEPAR
jgi:hypothetical protein